MGLLDRIINEIKTGIAEHTDIDISVKASSVPSAQPASAAYAQRPTYDTGDDYFAAMITEDKFPGYSIERSVHPGVLDSGAHPRCFPISYLFKRNGAPVLAVLVMNSNQSRAMIAVGTYQVLESRRIKYIRFFKGMENRESYVIGRIRENLV